MTPIKDVVIVGGGTAGWMTASYLLTAFPGQISVTLIESDRIGAIGVGEATFSTIRRFFDYLGLPESEWMPACAASYKLGIKFDGWRAHGSHFYHPFERLRIVDGFSLADWWLLLDGAAENFDDSVFLAPALCRAGRSPRFLDGTLFTSGFDGAIGRSTLSDQAEQFPYAYHFDASMLAGYLCEHAMRLGARRIIDDVGDVRLTDDGSIGKVVTSRHGEVSGQLFVDCTGFRSVLIGGALKEPFISFADALPNNRAVALRVPVNNEERGIVPFTTATAADAGWMWTIPLYGRNGVGYVYCDDFSSPENAEAALRSYAGADSKDLEAIHIRMRIGRLRNSWVRNCVAIGLSSGFVEPLESTGIFFIQYGIEELVRYFPDTSWNPEVIAIYNAGVARLIDGVKEFLMFHYRAAGRADSPYWRAVKDLPVSEEFSIRLAEWKEILPEARTIYPHYHGFEPYSWIAMALGLGHHPRSPRPALGMMDSDRARQELAGMARERRRLVRSLPSAFEYLRQFR